MPYYQFNSFTGRITESTHPQPFYPISPNRLERTEPPKIMYGTPDTKPVKIASATTSSPRSHFSTVDPKILKKMEIFQAPNNLPVHLKGGRPDRVLLAVTVSLITLGLGSSAKLIYDLAATK